MYHKKSENSKLNENMPVRSIQFIGWLPVFKIFGDCGNHPQFDHVTTPPPGYRFLTDPQMTEEIVQPRCHDNIDKLLAYFTRSICLDYVSDKTPRLLCQNFTHKQFMIIWHQKKYVLIPAKKSYHYETECMLVADNYRDTKYNIIECGGYWAVHQAEGAVNYLWFNLRINKHPLYYAKTKEKLLARFDKIIDSKKWNPQKKHRLRKHTFEKQYFSSLTALLAQALHDNEELCLQNVFQTGYDFFKKDNLYHLKLSSKRFQGYYSCPKFLKDLALKAKFLLYHFKAIGALILRSWRNGATLKTIMQFLNSRHLKTQVVLQNHNALFVPSIPFFIGQNPWVIEIEDFVSFCFPFLTNDQSKNAKITLSRYYPCLLALLQSPQCRAVITHIKSTADNMPKAFNMPELSQKIYYIPLGISPPQEFIKIKSSQINLLFTSSWHQHSTGFYLRGGLDVLYAFEKLVVLYPHIHLTLRTDLPEGLVTELYHRIKASHPAQITLVNHFLPKEKWQRMMAQTDIYLIPAARIHVASILEAMGYGHALVTSDGWGIPEYVEDGVTGLLAKGRYGVTSWCDPASGMLHENYEPLYAPNPDFIQQLIEKISLLIDNETLRENLGTAARQKVIEKFNIEQWNEGLKNCFDHVF